MKPTIIIILTALAAITLVGCQQEDPQGRETRTPLALDARSITIATTTRVTTTTAAADFFETGDELTVYALLPESATGTEYTTSFIATVDKAAGTIAWNLKEGATPIYLEDVIGQDWKPTHDFEAEFGLLDEVTDQSTPKLYHSADYVSVDLELNAATKTLSATSSMKRDHVQLIIQIAPGQGWATDGSDFLDYFNTSAVALHTTDVDTDIIPLRTDEATGITLTAILPDGYMPHTVDAKLATITPATGPARVLKLNTDLDRQSGHSYTITASLDNNGNFTTPTVTLKEWQNLPDIEAPAYSSFELGRFMQWAQRMTDPGNEWNEDFTLQADIDLSGIAWTPIGTSRSYSGTFDGGGHTISGLRVDTEAAFAGLFGLTWGATLKNLTLEDARIISTADCAGALVGHAGNSTLIGCQAIGCQVEALGIVGILIGQNAQSTLIASHVSGGTVTATSPDDANTAGLVGTNVGGSLIACVAEPDDIRNNWLHPDSNTGAIAGYNGDSGDIKAHINTCYWRTYTFQTGSVAKAVGWNSGTGTNLFYELPAAGIPQDAVEAMNTAIEAWNADNNNACQWRWTTTGITNK